MLRMFQKVIENYFLCLMARQYISVRGIGTNNGKCWYIPSVLGDAKDSNTGTRH